MVSTEFVKTAHLFLKDLLERLIWQKKDKLLILPMMNAEYRKTASMNSSISLSLKTSSSSNYNFVWKGWAIICTKVLAKVLISRRSIHIILRSKSLWFPSKLPKPNSTSGSRSLRIFAFSTKSTLWWPKSETWWMTRRMMTERHSAFSSKQPQFEALKRQKIIESQRITQSFG